MAKIEVLKDSPYVVVKGKMINGTLFEGDISCIEKLEARAVIILL